MLVGAFDAEVFRGEVKVRKFDDHYEFNSNWFC